MRSILSDFRGENFEKKYNLTAPACRHEKVVRNGCKFIDVYR